MKGEQLSKITDLMGKAYNETLERMKALSKEDATPERVLHYYTYVLVEKLKELQVL